MSTAYLSELGIKSFIQLALAEDLGEGDHTSLAAIPENMHNHTRLVMKDEGIIAGISLAERILLHVDPEIRITTHRKDGQEVRHDDVIFDINGNTRAVLKAERLVLNCMQRMSGIASYTRQLKTLIQDTPAQLLDTRKTTPNFRLAEKWAVLIGGGQNHRFGLFDRILLKDNHIDAAGGISKALESTQKYLEGKGLDLPVEVEVRTLEEVKQALATGIAHRLLLDNMDAPMLAEAVGTINGQAETEASGNITEHNIREVAETGVDFISVGALTYAYHCLDMSLRTIQS